MKRLSFGILQLDFKSSRLPNTAANKMYSACVYRHHPVMAATALCLLSSLGVGLSTVPVTERQFGGIPAIGSLYLKSLKGGKTKSGCPL